MRQSLNNFMALVYFHTPEVWKEIISIKLEKSKGKTRFSHKFIARISNTKNI